MEEEKRKFLGGITMKKIASLIAVLVVLCFATMVMAADAPKDDAAKATPAAADTAVKKAPAAKADTAAAPKVEKKAKKKAKKAPKKEVKKDEKKADAAAPAATEEKKQ
jgi:hypothetical protein